MVVPGTSPEPVEVLSAIRKGRQAWRERARVWKRQAGWKVPTEGGTARKRREEGQSPLVAGQT